MEKLCSFYHLSVGGKKEIASFCREGVQLNGKGSGRQQSGFFVFKRSRDISLRAAPVIDKLLRKGGFVVHLKIPQSHVKWPFWKMDVDSSYELFSLLKKYRRFFDNTRIYGAVDETDPLVKIARHKKQIGRVYLHRGKRMLALGNSDGKKWVRSGKNLIAESNRELLCKTPILKDFLFCEDRIICRDLFKNVMSENVKSAHSCWIREKMADFLCQHNQDFLKEYNRLMGSSKTVSLKYVDKNEVLPVHLKDLHTLKLIVSSRFSGIVLGAQMGESFIRCRWKEARTTSTGDGIEVYNISLKNENDPQKLLLNLNGKKFSSLKTRKKSRE